MKSSLIVIAALLVHVPFSAISDAADAPDANDCMPIEDDTQRLACYDKLFQRGTSEHAEHDDGDLKMQEKPRVPSSSASESETVARSTSESVAVASSSTETAAVPDLGKEQLPTKLENTIEARLVGDFTGWSGKTRFVLDNGQVWQQVRNYIRDYSPRDPIPQAQVTISKGLFGSYNLRVKGVKRIVQVKRIK